MSLPVELVDLTVQLYLDDIFSVSSLYCPLASLDTSSSKPEWQRVEPLSLTSWRIRKLSMAMWNSIFLVKEHDHFADPTDLRQPFECHNIRCFCFWLTQL
jgi:hypothetical protein